MKNGFRLFLVIALLSAFLPHQAAEAQALPEPTSCLDFAVTSPDGQPLVVAIPGTAPSGSETCITVPVDPTIPLQGLVIFAHGYVFAYPNLVPPIIPWDQMVLRDPATGEMQDTMPRLLNSLGFVFATTSYPKNGLTVKEGVASVVELVGVVQQTLAAYGMLPPGVQVPIFLVGASEGGLVTTLAVEQFPEIFTGGVAACGPVGDFRKQINYWGDFRVLFDYYFGNLLGSDPVSIPEEVMADWIQEPSMLQDQIRALLAADLQTNNGINTKRLLTASLAPIDLQDPSTIEDTILGILEYNVLATNEARMQLGGNPYTNEGKNYFALPYDRYLNQRVARVPASSVSPVAVQEIETYYQTSGVLSRPLVLLHTSRDPIVPFWHTGLYLKKAYASGSLRNTALIPILRYGHCQFKPEEALLAFEVMVIKAQRQAFTAQEVEKALPGAKARDEFRKLKENHKDAYK